MSTFHQTANGYNIQFSNVFKSVSGRPVSRYCLGGAARSTQPSTLPQLYCDLVQQQQQQQKNDDQSSKPIAPFFFYYNPHRYPDFLSGIQTLCDSSDDAADKSDDDDSTLRRQDLFIASGGTDRSPEGLEQRLQDALKVCGGDYLDMFVLEYVCPEELCVEFSEDPEDESNKNPIDRLEPGKELQEAIGYIRRNWLQSNQINKDEPPKVRHLAISSHSHVVGAVMAKHTDVEALMLRYSMSHKDAAETVSFPAAVEHRKPVMAFTTTRWNVLQQGNPGWPAEEMGLPLPTSADCLAFALSATTKEERTKPIVQVALHSARDEEELKDSVEGLFAKGLGSDDFEFILSPEEKEMWTHYGSLWEAPNEDFFDEYPEERFLKLENAI